MPPSALTSIKSICDARAAANDIHAMYLNPGMLFTTPSAYGEGSGSSGRNLDTVRQIVDRSSFFATHRLTNKETTRLRAGSITLLVASVFRKRSVLLQSRQRGRHPMCGFH